MALHSLYCADVPWRNCSLTHSMYYTEVWWSFSSFISLLCFVVRFFISLVTRRDLSSPENMQRDCEYIQYS